MDDTTKLYAWDNASANQTSSYIVYQMCRLFHTEFMLNTNVTEFCLMFNEVPRSDSQFIEWKYADPNACT